MQRAIPRTQELAKAPPIGPFQGRNYSVNLLLFRQVLSDAPHESDSLLFSFLSFAIRYSAVDTAHVHSAQG